MSEWGVLFVLLFIIMTILVLTNFTVMKILVKIKRSGFGLE
ncbi:hypothetical protein [Rossellomorea arthrocnemi]|nr:hypothetical protein [Rossellomorea arthrocnemi]